MFTETEINTDVLRDKKQCGGADLERTATHTRHLHLVPTALLRPHTTRMGNSGSSLLRSVASEVTTPWPCAREGLAGEARPVFERAEDRLADRVVVPRRRRSGRCPGSERMRCAADRFGRGVHRRPLKLRTSRCCRCAARDLRTCQRSALICQRPLLPGSRLEWGHGCTRAASQLRALRPRPSARLVRREDLRE
jgi:hypothetical protein